MSRVAFFSKISMNCDIVITVFDVLCGVFR